MDSRQRFEIEARKLGYGNLKIRVDNGCYEYAPTEHAWQGFQLGEKAARADIVVTLPRSSDDARTYGMLDRDETIEAIQSQGVMVK